MKWNGKKMKWEIEEKKFEGERSNFRYFDYYNSNDNNKKHKVM
jgi:hypothetical protein